MAKTGAVGARLKCISCTFRDPVVQSRLPHFTLHLSSTRWRKWMTYCTSNSAHFASAQCTTTTIRDMTKFVSLDVPTKPDAIHNCANWCSWCTHRVLHLRTTYLNSVKRPTAVNCAPFLYSGTGLRCAVECHFCALFKLAVSTMQKHSEQRLHCVTRLESWLHIFQWNLIHYTTWNTVTITTCHWDICRESRWSYSISPRVPQVHYKL